MAPLPIQTPPSYISPVKKPSWKTFKEMLVNSGDGAVQRNAEVVPVSSTSPDKIK